MSCETGQNKAAVGATRGGIPRLAAKAACYAGVGLAVAGATAAVAFKAMKSADQAFNQKVSQVISQIQRGAAMADNALAPEIPNEARSGVLKEGVFELVEAWGQIKQLRGGDSEIKGQLANFLADVLAATEDAETILEKPDDQVQLDPARKVFQSSRLVFLLPRRVNGNQWRTALFAGAAVGLAAAGVLGLAERRWRHARAGEKNNPFLHLGKFPR